MLYHTLEVYNFIQLYPPSLYRTLTVHHSCSGKSALWDGLRKIRIHIHVCSVRLFYQYPKPMLSHDILNRRYICCGFIFITITHCDANTLTQQWHLRRKFCRPKFSNTTEAKKLIFFFEKCGPWCMGSDSQSQWDILLGLVFTAYNNRNHLSEVSYIWWDYRLGNWNFENYLILEPTTHRQSQTTVCHRP